MKILYISSAQLPSKAANTVNVVKMCSAFARLGHEVTLTFRSGAERPDLSAHYGVAPSFRCERVSSRALPAIGGLLFGLALRRKALQWGRPDFIYGRNLYGVAALAGLGVPFSLELHAVPGKRHLRALLGWIARQPACAKVVVISAALQRDLLSAIKGIHESQILVAHDAADLLPACEDTVISSRVVSGRQGALQVGFIGHLYPGKGMEMVARLAGHLPEFDFHVVGGRDRELAFWRAHCNASNMHFHGFIPHAQLFRYYHAMDICIAPLQAKVQGESGGNIAKWTSPLKIFEYMSAGKAIVASDLPVLREVLTHEVNALLAPCDDVAAWGRSLRLLEADGALRSRLGKAAYEGFSTHHTWDSRAKLILAN